MSEHDETTTPDEQAAQRKLRDAHDYMAMSRAFFQASNRRAESADELKKWAEEQVADCKAKAAQLYLEAGEPALALNVLRQITGMYERPPVQPVKKSG
jgi:hypothetical protein